MQIRSFLAALAALTILSACVNLNDPQAIKTAIRVEHDDFKKHTNFTGPNAAKSLLDRIFIRAWKADSTGSITYQIYVESAYSYGEWRYYYAAFDSNGNSLNTTQISRNVDNCTPGGCIHHEHLGFNVSRNYLEQNQETGIRFKITGKAGEEIVSLPPAYIQAFLSVAK